MPNMERLIVLDTETTGIRPEEGHRIIEVGAVQILNREITNTEFHKYVQPNKPVGDSVNIHGITCLLYTSPSPRDLSTSRMPSSA